METPVAASDLTQAVRLVAIGLGMLNLGMATVIVRIYGQRAVAAGSPLRNAAAALPWHVTGMATAYCLFILALLFSHVLDVGDQAALGPRLVIATPGYLIGVVSLYALLRHINTPR